MIVPRYTEYAWIFKTLVGNRKNQFGWRNERFKLSIFTMHLFRRFKLTCYLFSSYTRHILSFNTSGPGRSPFFHLIFFPPQYIGYIFFSSFHFTPVHNLLGKRKQKKKRHVYKRKHFCLVAFYLFIIIIIIVIFIIIIIIISHHIIL